VERTRVTNQPTQRYEIQVQGALDPCWSAWFDGLEIGHDDDVTVISGPVTDQAALHGLLARINDLGLSLISVRRTQVTARQENPHMTTPVTQQPTSRGSAMPHPVTSDTARAKQPVPTTMPNTPGSAEPAIAVEEVTKRYGRRTALDNVSLEVPHGSVLALLGPNGAGKTTLVRVLTTLIRPDQGRALVAGHDVVAEPEMVRGAIGLVGQHAAVDEYLTGRENLSLVARLLRFDKTETRERVAAALDTFALGDVADVPAAAYSGGLRRRLDVAVTLLANPAVIFLDEPTTGLDPASRQGLWTLIEQLVADGTTILLTTQYLDEADRLADTVAVIDRGRTIATGTPEDLKTRLGDDTVHIRLAEPADLPEATRTLGEAGTITAVVHDQATLEVRAPNGAALLPEALRRLDARGLPVTTAEVRRPSLDDVFLALTGQPAAPAADHREPLATAGQRAHHHGTRSHP
jgi:ABC-2 type transport system ATP-binding protein